MDYQNPYTQNLLKILHSTKVWRRAMDPESSGCFMRWTSQEQPASGNSGIALSVSCPVLSLPTTLQKATSWIRGWLLSQGMGIYFFVLHYWEKSFNRLLFLVYGKIKYNMVEAVWWSQMCLLEDGFSNWPCTKIIRKTCMGPTLSFLSRNLGRVQEFAFVTHAKGVLLLI